MSDLEAIALFVFLLLLPLGAWVGIRYGVYLARKHRERD